jgi:hypothetical protein
MITCENFGSINYGRFGNQVFQYIICKILSTIHDTTFHLNPPKDFLFFFDNCLSYKPFDFINKQNIQYKESNPFYFDKTLFQKNNTDISGFFQNLKYYENFYDIIINELKPNLKILKNANTYINIKTQNAKLKDIVCIHIRRTDYTKSQHFYNFLNIDYYLNIISEINYTHAFIISDDIKNLKKEFEYKDPSLLKNIFFVDELDVYHQFYIMYLAGINVLSNSTFGWWSAFLSHLNYPKNVHIPYPWVNSKNANLYPTHWQKHSFKVSYWDKLFS